MLTLLILIVSLLIFLSLVLSFVCYKTAFFSRRHTDSTGADEFPLPDGDIYKPYHSRMIDWMKETRALPHRDFTVTSFDGLKLHGKYYECKKGAPVELMFHGYRGCGERDLCGSVQRCFRLERNVLIVDQRGSGLSGGKVITFGINESRDVLTWIDFIIKEFGKDTRIILTGISMGGATVLTASGRELPKNVVCILADCSYSSAKEIIKKVIAERRLPPNLLYPFMRIGARLFGHFRLHETSPIDAMKRCKVPVIFIHGENDTYVPCDMSRRVFDACTAEKTIFTVPSAGHGLSYLVDTEGYFNTLNEFCKKNNI